MPDPGRSPAPRRCYVFRASCASNDSDDYWQFHVAKEHEAVIAAVGLPVVTAAAEREQALTTDASHQRVHELHRVVPVVLPAANEVVRDHGAGAFSPVQPRCEQRAFAHARATGHHDPAVGAVLDQELIEPRQQRGTLDEARVSCSFCREVEPRPLRRRERGYRGSMPTGPPPVTTC